MIYVHYSRVCHLPTIFSLDLFALRSLFPTAFESSFLIGTDARMCVHCAHIVTCDLPLYLSSQFQHFAATAYTKSNLILSEFFLEARDGWVIRVLYLDWLPPIRVAKLVFRGYPLDEQSSAAFSCIEQVESV